jgi:hypothetical protein
MYKTVSFNIFEENLEDVVYRNDSGFQRKETHLPEKDAEKNARKSTEIIINPVVDLKSGRESERK